VEPGYSVAHDTDGLVALRHSPKLPPPGIDEHWRCVYADVTAPPGGADEMRSPAFVDALSRWLVDNQPITLATNDEAGDFALARSLFEGTGQVVYTVGDLQNPALTCQARPQDGEVFGEFPVRRELQRHTTFPVVVPSPTPGYNAAYTDEWLEAEGARLQSAVRDEIDGTATKKTRLPADAAGLAGAVGSDRVRGFLGATLAYLADALAQNPKRGRGARTCLYGLQTTPLNGQLNFVRCGAATTVDDAALWLWPFLVTTARPLLRVSVDEGNEALATRLEAAGVECTVEDDAAFRARAEDAYNVIEPAAASEFGFPLVGHFVSLLFCCGHVKSAVPGANEDFVAAFEDSDKWLQMRG
jgi:hypothetical protein